ncbi:alanine--glyoxylate aminotransferase family protein [Bacillus sp. FJAT-29790]|uniref:pyridoxal-phosphate-dependent aminotransferase family protein n=1 Tax=Bacillus sp. FJAT-29790 TaxID=1895002 RepID=UPI001C22EB47|nr:alanine--glyoxylate aminotransferase family protein [Bacillus sp. FJAT-29790]MBU8877380.1 alanine--glyoxylate aminotransferase family protein [Bacillus sp. FJAT-29790]
MLHELNPSLRTLMTPGPVEAEPRVLRAMTIPIIGQFDQEFLGIMDETMELLRKLFQTKNHWAYTIDGTARSGSEAVLCSIIEPGDKVLVPIFGRFGHLLAEIAYRCGADVSTIECEWGTAFEEEEIIAEIRKVNPKIVALVHGETSTGIMQPLDIIGKFCHDNDVLFVVDAVATIAGTDFRTDEWNIDAAITGTQKCLGVPTGMAPITYNERIEKILLERRKIEQGLDITSSNPRRIQSNYFDLSQIQEYWSPKRLNHHTEATSMLYALREGLRIIHEEGLQNRFDRHKLHENALVAGLRAMGLTLFGDSRYKMPVVTCVNIPEGVNGDEVRSTMVKEFGVEIASTFGSLAGKIWRIGSMGFSCRKENILKVLAALEASIYRHGGKVNAGEAVQAALDIYEGKALAVSTSK